jgi:cell wall-associated NlpC family hydrolase
MTLQMGISETGYDKESSEQAIRGTIVAFCEAQLGEIYNYAIEHSFSEVDPYGWDCSEMVENAYNRAGLAYPDGCRNQLPIVEHRRVLEPKAGDVFFYGPNKNGPHTGVYTGRGTAIHALGGKVGEVVEQPRYIVESHPRFLGWFRHPEFSYPADERA